MDTQQALLAAIHADPRDGTAWLALADWLEETGRTDQAELTRNQTRLAASPARREHSRCQTRVQELLAAGTRPVVPLLRLAINKHVALEAALIPPGTFLMGSTVRERGGPGLTDEHPRHPVTLTRPYYLGIYPVTQAQYHALLPRRPCHFKGKDRPADQVGWEDARLFCNLASQATGQVIRLATEAEWEYACRAGTRTAFASGDGESAMERAGWCDCEETQPVGQKQPNGWGLYDMHGNVWEWCHDAHASYRREPGTDPVVEGDTSERTARGGSYSNPSRVCRSASRIGFLGGGRNEFIGFRVAVSWQKEEG